MRPTTGRRNPIVGREIAFRIRMKKRWLEDREGMLKRSKAGAKAMAARADRNREAWAGWLSKRSQYMSKQQLIESISKAMDPFSTSKPYSVLVRLIRYDLVTFDLERMEYKNNCAII